MENRLLAKLPDEARQILFEVHGVDGIRPKSKEKEIAKNINKHAFE